MSTDLLSNGPLTLPLTTLGVVLVVVALGAWLTAASSRPAWAFGAAGAGVLVLATVVGWVEESRDVDRLRAALQERGVAISKKQAQEVRDTLNDGRVYASPPGSPRDWRVVIADGELRLRLTPLP